MSGSAVVAYTSAEAARELNVNPATVLRWLEEGALVETWVVAGRGRYVTAKSVLDLKTRREAPAPELQAAPR